MPPSRRPARPAPRAVPKKKGSPVALWGGIGGGVLLLIIIVIVALPSGGGDTAPVAPALARSSRHRRIFPELLRVCVHSGLD